MSVYLDETYLLSAYSVPSCWQSDAEVDLTKTVSKGPREIIVHTVGENGFVKFKSGLKTGDYHDDMNYYNFSIWISDKLLPNFPVNSVIGLCSRQ